MSEDLVWQMQNRSAEDKLAICLGSEAAAGWKIGGGWSRGNKPARTHWCFNISSAFFFLLLVRATFGSSF